MIITIVTRKKTRRFESRRLKPWVRTFIGMLTAVGAASLVGYGINYGAVTQQEIHPAIWLVPIYTVITLATGWMIRKWCEEVRREMIGKRRNARRTPADRVNRYGKSA